VKASIEMIDQLDEQIADCESKSAASAPTTATCRC